MLVKRAFQEIQLSQESLNKIASKEKRIIPVGDSDNRYLRFRSIANLEVNGFNGNWDGFSYKWFVDPEQGYGYKSFVNKPAHYEHNSALKKQGSIGDLPDAYLNRFIYPENFPYKYWEEMDGAKFASKRQEILDLPNQKDGAIEVLMRIDASLLNQNILEPKTQRGLRNIIHSIDTGKKLYCSMGVNICHSTCSACGNIARFSSDYCNHIQKGRKGGLTVVTANSIRDLLDKDLLRPEWLKHVVASKFDIDEILKGSSNKGVAVRNGEINHKLSFFELSVVGTPAYEQADALEKVASQVDGDYLEYLKQQRKILGDNVFIDVYSMMQNEGLIAKSCSIGQF